MQRRRSGGEGGEKERFGSESGRKRRWIAGGFERLIHRTCNINHCQTVTELVSGEFSRGRGEGEILHEAHTCLIRRGFRSGAEARFTGVGRPGTKSRGRHKGDRDLSPSRADASAGRRSPPSQEEQKRWLSGSCARSGSQTAESPPGVLAALHRTPTRIRLRPTSICQPPPWTEMRLSTVGASCAHVPQTAWQPRLPHISTREARVLPRGTCIPTDTPPLPVRRNLGV